MIRHLAQSIAQSLPDGSFLGHVGGDDFVAIVSCPEVPAVCSRMIAAFDISIHEFYSEEDTKNGYIRSRNRQGQEELYPLISLSIAGVSVRPTGFRISTLFRRRQAI